MVKCPNCRKETEKPRKTWKYWQFDVKVYVCEECNTKFRDYSKGGKHVFTLKFQKGKGFIKA